MTEEKFIKDFTFTVRKIGKRWIEALKPGYDKPVSIELNAQTTGLLLGGTYTIAVKKLTERSRFGTVSKYIPVSPADMPDYIRDEIARWIGFIEEKAATGWLYEKGVQKAVELGASLHQDLAARLQAAILLAATEKGRKNIHYISRGIKRGWYENGEDRVLEAINELRSLGNDHEADRLAAELGDLAQRSGRTPKQHPVTSSERPAHACPDNAHNEKAGSAAKRLDEIAQLITAEGQKPAPMYAMASKPFFPTPQSEEDVMYGGGWWFLLEPDGSLWHCRNNGMDGCNTSASNVATWGTGAIGWKLPAEDPKTAALRKEIQDLAILFGRIPNNAAY